ncbi:hypothetical protein LCGC14_2785520, partial [marine sediment metagenome]
VPKFKYIARVVGHWYTVQDSGSALVYAGDFPDFALDRLEVALKCGVQTITIHSTQPLPVRREPLPKMEPVLLGWASDQISFTQEKGRVKAPSALGVVIAAWDLDKELEVL